MPSVLIVDDLLSIHEMLDAVIQPTGFSTAFATDGEKALSRYKTERFDLILADIDMKPMDGITLLKQVKQYDPSAVVIIMTAYASTESAVQALKFGAFDYLQKPFRVDELIATLKRGVEYKNFHAEQKTATSATPVIKPTDVESRLIGPSAANKKLIQQVRKLATVRTPVLLQGEPGVGKATVADILHAISVGTEAPLIRVDCASSGEPDFQQNLIGDKSAGGPLIQQAKGGTLLLKSIDALPLPMQQELVAVLRNTAQSFRLVCTTTEDLEKLTDEGRFNDELFYRVASLPMAIPPLRSRTEDLPALIKHFLTLTTNHAFETHLIEFTEDAMAGLSGYHWPGNLAELSQIVTNLAASTDTRQITAKQLPLRLKEVKSWPKLSVYLAKQEAEYIELVLGACRRDKAAAAKILGVEASRLG